MFGMLTIAVSRWTPASLAKLYCSSSSGEKLHSSVTRRWPSLWATRALRRRRTARNKMASIAQSVLAVEGGARVRTIPFPAWPQISSDEIEAASAVLASGKINYWTGEEGRLFEKEFAASVKRKYAVALANGSVALELALYALGIGPGDEVIVPSRSFIASASCVSMRGATPVFADADRDSGNPTASTVAPHISKKTKAIIAVHLGGWPCDVDSISALAAEHGLKVIEDCAQAQGAT